MFNHRNNIFTVATQSLLSDFPTHLKAWFNSYLTAEIEKVCEAEVPAIVL